MMKNAKTYSIIFIVFSFYFSAFTQDLHFTQFFANPISYNPANTGFFQGDYRLGANHKEQWPWAKDGSYTNYNTSSIYADFALLENKLNKTDWLGVGVNYIHDQAGDGNLLYNKLFVSLAYHKGLDKQHKHFISLGFTAAYVDRAINFKELYFNNQWKDRVGFVRELPNFENLSTERFSYFDLGFGIQVRNMISKKIKLTYGFTMLHINQPKETFYDQSNKIGIRYLAHAVAEYELSQKVNLMSSVYFTAQKTAIESLFGALVDVEVAQNKQNKSSKLIGGVFYRWNDALSPILGYQYHTTRILMNFDFNLSSLSSVSRSNGGFEISLVHTGNWNKKLPSHKKVNCYVF